MTQTLEVLHKESRRKYLRFEPDPLDIALIDPTGHGGFDPKYVALIFQEAWGGCGLTFHYHEELASTLAVGSVVRIKVGRMGVLKAEVVWHQHLGENLILRAGFKFLE